MGTVITLVPPAAVGCVGFYLRCVGWGVATGAATGGLAGALVAVLLFIGGTLSNVALVSLLAGAVIGSLVAVIPSALGALVVTAVIGHRHRRPAAPEAVRTDVTRVLLALVGLLDLALLVAALAGGAGGYDVLEAFPYVAVVNVCVAVVLRWAVADLSQAWSGGAST